MKCTVRFGKSVRAAGMALLLGVSAANAGSIFLTGHDPDFHASLGGNTLGAQHINQTAIGFIMNPAFNPFVAGGLTKFIYVQSFNAPVPGNTDGANGLIASGYLAGTNFDQHGAGTLNAALNLLGVAGGYGGIVIASDHGGMLTQAELNILNARSADIINFLNAGGGLYAMAESNSVGQLPGGGFYGFLPFIVSSTTFNQSGVGHTVTAFGAGLGLTNADINGNFEHNIFNANFGLNVVDTDPLGQILTLAGRAQVTAGGIPEPTSILFSLITVGLGLAARRRWAKS